MPSPYGTEIVMHEIWGARIREGKALANQADRETSRLKFHHVRLRVYLERVLEMCFR
jgi:hypothetical protein